MVLTDINNGTLKSKQANIMLTINIIKKLINAHNLMDTNAREACPIPNPTPKKTDDRIPVVQPIRVSSD